MNSHQERQTRVSRWRDFVTDRLGRAPRGFADVAAFNARGEPSVIRVSSVVDEKPFPTLFWLIDAEASLNIDRLEAQGWIARFQAFVDSNDAFKLEMLAAHQAHKTLRQNYLSGDDRGFLESRGMMSALSDRGIGGIKEPDRIRCFHTWYAAHLVQSNCVGNAVNRLLNAIGDPDESKVAPAQVLERVILDLR